MTAWSGRPSRARHLADVYKRFTFCTRIKPMPIVYNGRDYKGKHTDTSHTPLTYWSTGSSRASEVAILLNPKSALDASVWEQDLWGTRAVALSINGIVLLNVQTPTLRDEREEFFSCLSRWNLPRDSAIVLGNDKCAQSLCWIV